MQRAGMELTASPPPRRSTPFRTGVANPFSAVMRVMTGTEIHMGDTVSFLGEVDLTEVERIRTSAGAAKPSYTAFVIKALGLALREFPFANQRLYRPWWPFARLRLQRFEACDVGVLIERDSPGNEAATFMDVLR